jgi:hypothetical protein
LPRSVTQKGLFNDPSGKIDEITSVFKRDIKSINSEFEALVRFAGKQQNLLFALIGSVYFDHIV